MKKFECINIDTKIKKTMMHYLRFQCALFRTFPLRNFICYVHTMRKNDSKCIKAVQKIVMRLIVKH